jgi:hypothetical protein
MFQVITFNGVEPADATAHRPITQRAVSATTTMRGPGLLLIHFAIAVLAFAARQYAGFVRRLGSAADSLERPASVSEENRWRIGWARSQCPRHHGEPTSRDRRKRLENTLTAQQFPRLLLARPDISRKSHASNSPAIEYGRRGG